MDPLDILFHLAGFVAPALAVALLLAAAARLAGPGQAKTRSWWSQSAINSVVGVTVLIAGLWYFGVDGKMATYAALVAAVATCQWACSRAWRS